MSMSIQALWKKWIEQGCEQMTDAELERLAHDVYRKKVQLPTGTGNRKQVCRQLDNALAAKSTRGIDKTYMDNMARRFSTEMAEVLVHNKMNRDTVMLIDAYRFMGAKLELAPRQLVANIPPENMYNFLHFDELYKAPKKYCRGRGKNRVCEVEDEEEDEKEESSDEDD